LLLVIKKKYDMMSKLTFIKLVMLLCFVFGASNESWAL